MRSPSALRVTHSTDGDGVHAAAVNSASKSSDEESLFMVVLPTSARTLNAPSARVRVERAEPGVVLEGSAVFALNRLADRVEVAPDARALARPIAHRER
jgi:hypothetical protein